MIRNYFTIALRNIQRNISHTTITIACLSLGITCSLVLFLLISFLTSFDNYHPNGDRIYRFVAKADWGREDFDFTPGVPGPFAEAVRSDIAGIADVLQISGRWKALVKIEQNGARRMFEEENSIAYTDDAYFRFFQRNVISGSGTLQKPNEAVISRKWAEKYFGSGVPVCKVITIDNTQDFVITGVMDDHPRNTSFPFELLMSYETVRQAKLAAGWFSASSDD